MDFARTEVLAAVERDQHASLQTPERLQRGGGSRQTFQEQPVEGDRRNSIEHQPDVIVTRDGGDPKQRLAIRPAMPLRQRPLISQEGGAAHEKQRERRQADIGHRIGVRVGRPLAPVRQTSADLPQIRDQALQHTHAAFGSCAKPSCNAKRLTQAGSPGKPLYRDQPDRLAPELIEGPPKPAPGHLEMQHIRIENRCRVAKDTALSRAMMLF